MKHEEEFWLFSLYDLIEYAKAKSRRITEEEFYEYAVQEMYDNIPVTHTIWDSEAGRIAIGGVSVEDAAIEIASFKVRYEKMIAKLKKKEELFEIAMSELSPRERDVIKMCHLGVNKKLGLSEEYFYEIRKQAEMKLRKHLYALKQEEIRGYEEERKQAIREKARFLRGASMKEMDDLLARENPKMKIS